MLIESFRKNPPEGFSSIRVDVEDEYVPAFRIRFDLLTTLNGRMKEILSRLGFLLPKPKTMFLGTTVSEYSIFPLRATPESLAGAAFDSFSRQGDSLLIIKDVPLDSPLLSEEDNRYSSRLLDVLRAKKFMIVEGEALAYVPIRYESIGEFLSTFSASRRKDFKRKLRSRDSLAVDHVMCGSDAVTESFVDEFYSLYENVYNDSEVHFDKLSRNFFSDVLKDPSNGGIVFVYKNEGRVIGCNLAFVIGDKLVDKYIGFRYPESHEFNLYFVSWFYNIEFCINRGLKFFVAGWTDPKIKKYLGADFTLTHHAVYVKNPVFRLLLRSVKGLFESDSRIVKEK